MPSTVESIVQARLEITLEEIRQRHEQHHLNARANLWQGCAVGVFTLRNMIERMGPERFSDTPLPEPEAVADRVVAEYDKRFGPSIEQTIADEQGLAKARDRLSRAENEYLEEQSRKNGFGHVPHPPHLRPVP